VSKTFERHERFGERLANLRANADLTQQQLADALGISRRAVAYYERETTYPPSEHLGQLADVLNCTVDGLLGREEQRRPTASRPTPKSQTLREDAPTDYTKSASASDFRERTGDQIFGTVLADPPWRFENRTGKVAPEHRRLSRYETMTLSDIMALPVASAMAERAHLYLWVPNALLLEGVKVLEAWGFNYKSNLVWHKVRKDGGPDGRGVGFYFRNTTELILFGVRGKDARTLAPGRRQVNILKTRKREHSRKPDELYPVIEACSRGPFLELFARGSRPGWTTWGHQADAYTPTWATYANHSQSHHPSSTLDLFALDCVNEAERNQSST
jgi:N6-adenosine-specific RNA methylase IME4/DNA-binding XRE family transcriptional regulator